MPALIDNVDLMDVDADAMMPPCTAALSGGIVDRSICMYVYTYIHIYMICMYECMYPRKLRD
jgi:hypothetical protein